MRDRRAPRLLTATLVTLALVAVVGGPHTIADAAPQSRPDSDLRRARAVIQSLRSQSRPHTPEATAGPRHFTMGPMPTMSVQDPIGDAASPHGDITGAGF